MTRTEKKKIIKQQWLNLFRGIINEVRKAAPDDPRTDVELAESLMEHFHEGGLVPKHQNGKYILPYIIPDE